MSVKDQQTSSLRVLGDSRESLWDKSCKQSESATAKVLCEETSRQVFPALSSFALEVIACLEEAGYETWLVGGWVRDAVMGVPSHDIDIACSAPWGVSAELLRAHNIAVHETGTQHGTISVARAGELIEITTFRTEGVYSDGRHPDRVTFTDDIVADLSRRDFTINAIAYHPARGVLDPYGGVQDICTHTLKTVGTPQERLREDGLRVLRAVRIAARFNLDIEDATQQALIAHAHMLGGLPRERIGQEMRGLLATGRMAWALTHESEVLCEAIPNLAPLHGFDQRSKYHFLDVYEHTAHVCASLEALCAGSASEDLRWAALFHDIAKPETFFVDEDGFGHFYGHPEKSAHIAFRVMRAMAVPGDIVRSACLLVRMHDYFLKATKKSLHKFLARLNADGAQEVRSAAYKTLLLMQADALAKAQAYRSYAYELDECRMLLRELEHAHPALSVQDLALSGEDIMREKQLSEGPEVGALLKALLQEVIAGELPNTKEALLERLCGRA